MPRRRTYPLSGRRNLPGLMGYRGDGFTRYGLVERVNTITSTTASRSGSTSRPQRVSVEEYERDPNRWKNPIPVQGTQEGRTIMYVAEEAGNGR